MPKPPIPRANVLNRGGNTLSGSALQKDLGRIATIATTGGTSGTQLTLIQGGTTLSGVGTLVIGDGLTLAFEEPGIASIERASLRVETYIRLTEDEGGSEFFPLTWVYLDQFSEFELQVYETSGSDPTDYVVEYYNTATTTWTSLSGDAIDVTTDGDTGTIAPEVSGLKTIDPDATGTGGVSIRLVDSSAGASRLSATIYLRGEV